MGTSNEATASAKARSASAILPVACFDATDGSWPALMATAAGEKPMSWP